MVDVNAGIRIVKRVLLLCGFTICVALLYCIIGGMLWGRGIIFILIFNLMFIGLPVIVFFGVLLAFLIVVKKIKKKSVNQPTIPKPRITVKHLIPEITVIIIFSVLFVYGQASINHPIEGSWINLDTNQYIQIFSHLDEGGDHFHVDGYIWHYKYNPFSKEMIIDGYDSNYSSFVLRLKAEVIDGKLHLNYIDSSDGIVRFDQMVYVKIREKYQ